MDKHRETVLRLAVGQQFSFECAVSIAQALATVERETEQRVRRECAEIAFRNRHYSNAEIRRAILAEAGEKQ